MDLYFIVHTLIRFISNKSHTSLITTGCRLEFANYKAQCKRNGTEFKYRIPTGLKCFVPFVYSKLICRESALSQLGREQRAYQMYKDTCGLIN